MSSAWPRSVRLGRYVQAFLATKEQRYASDDHDNPLLRPQGSPSPVQDAESSVNEPSNAATVDLVLDATKYAAPGAQAASVCARLSGHGVLASTSRERRYGLVVIRTVRIERAAVTFPGLAPQLLNAEFLATAPGRQTAQVHRAIKQQLSEERLERFLWADPRV